MALSLEQATPTGLCLDHTILDDQIAAAEGHHRPTGELLTLVDLEVLFRMHVLKEQK